MEKYYKMQHGGNCFKKQEQGRNIYVGFGNGQDIISIKEGKEIIPNYYEECTRDEFIAAYQKVKELLIGVQI